jgi:hypothetical protein
VDICTRGHQFGQSLHNECRNEQSPAEAFPMWSRIHSIAQEVELWMSLSVNGWLMFRVAVYLNRKIGSLIRLVRASLFVAYVLSAATIVAVVVCMFNSAAIDWYYGLATAGISVSLFGIALTQVEGLRRHFQHS